MSNIPRKKRKPDRYGATNKNMDDLFDSIDRTTPSDDEDDADNVDLSNSEKITTQKDEFQKPERQFARFEAKLNQIHLLLIQIQRACISDATTSLLELERIPELPLPSEESLDKFELDLSEDSYRQKIVSTGNSKTVSDFLLEI